MKERCVMASLARIQRNPRGKAWARRRLGELLGSKRWDEDAIVSIARKWLAVRHFDLLSVRAEQHYLLWARALRS